MVADRCNSLYELIHYHYVKLLTDRRLGQAFSILNPQLIKIEKVACAFYNLASLTWAGVKPSSM